MADHSKGYTITRTFDAPRQLVWDALTQAEHFGVWFGTAELEMRDMQMDARVGGYWSGTMVLPDGSTMSWRGKFIEVDPIERLVHAFSDEDSFDLERPAEELELLTTTLTETPDGKTELVFRQSGGHLSDEPREGSASFLDALADLLEELQQAA